MTKNVSKNSNSFCLEGLRATDIIDPDYIKPRLYCSVIDAATNENILKICPHELIADLAVIPRCRLGDNASFLFTNELKLLLNLSDEEIMAQAHMNDLKQGYTCRGITEVIRSMIKAQEFSAELSEEFLEAWDNDTMYVLSKNGGIDGAAVVTERSFLSTVHDRFGEDFYILPSSRHEVLAIPYSRAPSVDELKKMVRSVNINEVAPSDRLSDQVYFFNGHTFDLAESFFQKSFDK